jgi:hypothetical protein
MAFPLHHGSFLIDLIPTFLTTVDTCFILICACSIPITVEELMQMKERRLNLHETFEIISLIK